LVIYNPNSGKRINTRDIISRHLEKNGIPFEFYETKGPLDGLYHAMNCDLQNYSAIAAVGGDGTIHEILNGVLKRPDGKKVPIALLPNGTGNDACGGIKVDTMDEGLNYLVAGDVIYLDVIKCLIDYSLG
jgi:diacylglycerol kinase (ATP)